MKRVSLVLVTHRSSAVVGAAVESFRSAAAYAAVIGEVVIVEQSEDEGELEAVRAAGADTVIARRNRGYAAGVNAGISEATGDVIFVGNPDIRFERPSLSPLLNALDDGYALVGPLFTLEGFLLPPADVQRPGAELRRLRAQRNPRSERRHLRREIRYWRALWEATEPVVVRSLSGALIGFTRKVAYQLGPWDEKYFLYFEESDWCLRAERAGLRIAQVPASRVEHRWAHSADPASLADVFAKARERFYKKNFKSDFLLGLPRVEEGATENELPPFRYADSEQDGQQLWLASPHPWGFPAGGRMLSGDPSEAFHRILAATPLARVFVFEVQPERGRVSGGWTFSRKVARKKRAES